MDERMKKVISDIFGVSLSEIHEDSSPETIKNWDSLRHMNLLIALEEAFGVQLD